MVFILIRKMESAGRFLVIPFVVALLLGVGSPAFAAGSVTQTLAIIQNTNTAVVTFSWTADAGAATVPATATSDAITAKITGMYVTQVVTNPGATAPTTLYDITITDADGLDIMGGTLANRSATVTERAIPKIDTVNNIFGSAIVPGAITMNLTNNSVNSAVGTVVIYLSR